MMTGGWRLPTTGGLRLLDGPSLVPLDDPLDVELAAVAGRMMRDPGTLLTLKALPPTLPDMTANLGGGDSIAADASMANGMEASVMARANADETINLAPERQNDVWA
jgi:hypothetical protein